ncbi:MAG: beta-propeller fold lactonase family protein [bacterium]
MNYRILLAVPVIIATACTRDNMEPTRPSAADRTNSSAASAVVGNVYTLTNAASGNAVLSFGRYADGTLAPADTFATTGNGTGGGLGSQGAVVLSQDGQQLFAVDAGSNQVTSFRVTSTGLVRASTVSSGGTLPISVTEHGGLLYVLNAGGAGNIAGFRVDGNANLAPLAESKRNLGGTAVDPAEVSFSPDGGMLVVTEKAVNRIATYIVGVSGTPSAAIVNNSAGQTPFGFSFDSRGTMVVSEAFGGAPGLSAASSYRINANGTLQVLSASVPTHQTSACWAVVTNSGLFAYLSNTGSGTVSGYNVHDRRLTLLDASGLTGSTGPGTADAALAGNSQFLYTRNGGDKSISAFQVNNGTGALTSLSGVAGLPAGSVGLAAR